MEILSVADFNKMLNGVFSEMGEFSVQGEVVSMRISSNRALFIDLKDKNENALLKITNFAPWVEGIKSIDAGMDVIVHGPVEVYSPYGTMSLKARKIEPVGAGSLQKAFELLKSQLEKEGLFALERKRPLPKFISRIVLITGKDSAAYADFTKIIKENLANIAIDFIPVLVQGKNSEREVAGAIDQANRMSLENSYDAICLVRGGGSLEDLQSFNSEKVARAIFASHIPVVSGVGHEVDTTIADLVADVRASTPSQAAYYLVSQNLELIERIRKHMQKVEEKLREVCPTPAEVDKNIYIFNLSLNNYLNNIQNQLYKINNLDNFSLQLQVMLQRISAEVDSAESLLKSYNPENVLQRGFSLIKSKDKYLSDGKSLKSGDKVTLVFRDTKKSAQIN